MARPSGRTMGYPVWDQPLIDFLSHFLQWCMQCHVILDRVMTALDCIYTWLDKTCLLSRYEISLKITHHSLTIIMCCPKGWNRRRCNCGIDYINVILEVMLLSMLIFHSGNFQPTYNMYFVYHVLVFIQCCRIHQSCFHPMIRQYIMTSSKWKHFPQSWPFVREVHLSPVDSHHRGQWRGVLVFFLICFWTNGWVRNRDTCDLRRHRAHYEVTVMINICHIFPAGK